MKEYSVWLLAQVFGGGNEQPVPAFGGFISATRVKPTQKSTIDYFTPINQPFTEYAVIEELLKRSEEATKGVGQEYVLSTFDLGGCMKALPLPTTVHKTCDYAWSLSHNDEFYWYGHWPQM